MKECLTTIDDLLDFVEGIIEGIDHEDELFEGLGVYLELLRSFLLILNV